MTGLLLANALYFAIGVGLLPLLRIAPDRAALVARLPLAYAVGLAATGIVAAHLALIDVQLGLVELVVLAAIVLFLGLRKLPPGTVPGHVSREAAGCSGRARASSRSGR